MSRIVFATDLHLTEGQGGLAPFTTDLLEITALSPDLLVMGGDICLWEAGAGDQLQRLLTGTPFPTVCLMGNHDTDRHHPLEFDRDFATHFGACSQHVIQGDAHVVTLNTCRMQPEYDDWRNVRAEVGADDLTWLDSTLASLKDDHIPLLVFVHIPLATTYPERRGADRATTDVWRVTNASAVLKRLHAWTAPVVVCQGHLHENEHLHHDGVHLISVGSVCGRWWQQGDETRCTDDSPRGWLVIDVSDGDVHVDYQPARTPRWHGEIVDRADGVGGDWLNLFFADPAETVEIRIDGSWRQLPSPAPAAVDETFFSVHHWTLPAGFAGDAVEVRTRMRGRLWDMGVVHRR